MLPGRQGRVCKVKVDGQGIAAQVLEQNKDSVNTIPDSSSVGRYPVLCGDQ